MDPEAPAVGAQPLRGPRARGAQPFARAARRGRGPRGPRACRRAGRRCRRPPRGRARRARRRPPARRSRRPPRRPRRSGPRPKATLIGMSAPSPVGDVVAVVDVDVAVDVGDPERSDGVAQAGQRAGHQRAAAAEHQRLARRPRRRRARPRARPLVVASVSAMPITPLAGSRSSPRIRTSRSPRSSAPMRAGRPCSRSAAGACSVPPARPTESIGTPMAVQGADTRRGYRAARRAPGRRTSVLPPWTGKTDVRPS